jgi:soluble lytic murein transglycosylase-like protein
MSNAPFLLLALVGIVAFMMRKSYAIPSLGSLDTVFSRVENIYNLPQGVLKAIAWRESRFKPAVITGQQKGAAGEIGIMQILPKWHPTADIAQLGDPVYSINYAGKFLRQLLSQFNGSLPLAIAAYNWGSGNVTKYLQGSIKTVPEAVQQYVQEVTGVRV